MVMSSNWAATLGKLFTSTGIAHVGSLVIDGFVHPMNDVTVHPMNDVTVH